MRRFESRTVIRMGFDWCVETHPLGLQTTRI